MSWAADERTGHFPESHEPDLSGAHRHIGNIVLDDHNAQDLGIMRKFVNHFSSMDAPLTALTSKDTARQYKWNDWGQVELTGFQQLKEAPISALVVLAVPD